MAANVLKDFEKLGVSTNKIKESQQKIQDITKRLEAGSLSAANIERIKQVVKKLQRPIVPTRAVLRRVQN